MANNISKITKHQLPVLLDKLEGNIELISEGSLLIKNDFIHIIKFLLLVFRILFSLAMPYLGQYHEIADDKGKGKEDEGKA